VSSATIAQIQKIQASHTLNWRAVKSGTISINTAATVASLPADAQLAAARRQERAAAGGPAGVESKVTARPPAAHDASVSDSAESPEQDRPLEVHHHRFAGGKRSAESRLQNWAPTDGPPLHSTGASVRVIRRFRTEPGRIMTHEFSL
jgi:hypothetical protein